MGYRITTDGYVLQDSADQVEVLCEDTDGSVRVEFDNPEERYAEDPEALANIDQTAVESWANGAGVIVDGNQVQVWVSTGDPRGAFTMTLRRLDNGEIIIHLPYEGEGLPHEETRQISPGTLVIKRTEADD